MLGPYANRYPRLSFAIMLTLAWTAALGFYHALPGAVLFDYGSFFESGVAAREGLNPYAIYPRTFRVVLPGFEVYNPNLNPPISLPLFELIGRVDPHVGFRAWWLLSLLGYAACVLLLVRRYGREAWLVTMLWAFALAGFWDTLALGQIYIPLVLAAVGAWLLLERDRARAAGLLIGLIVAMKPNFLIWPGLLLLAGHRRAAIAAFATAALLSAVPALLYGLSVYQQWLDLILSDRGRAVFLTNASLIGLALRAGAGALGVAASGALCVGLAWWAWRSRPPALLASTVGLIGAILVSPIAWIHYTLFLLPVFFAHAGSWPLRISAALLTVPATLLLHLIDAPLWVQLTFGSIYAWAVILCFAGVVMGEASARRAAPRVPAPALGD